MPRRSRLAWVVRARHYERWKRHGNPLHHEHDGKPLCAVEGCPSRALSSAPPEHGERRRGHERVDNHRYCRKHYERWKRYGDPLGQALCAVEGCKGTVDAKGLCPTHYRRLKLYGDPLKLKRDE